MPNSTITNNPDHSIVILGRVNGKNSSIFGFNELVQSYLLLKYGPAEVEPHGPEEEQISIQGKKCSEQKNYFLKQLITILK